MHRYNMIAHLVGIGVDVLQPISMPIRLDISLCHKRDMLMQIQLVGHLMVFVGGT